MSGYPLLSGVRVLEVAQLAPSSVGGHLADLGAEVIKVESGALGDPVRAGGAFAVGHPDGPALMHLRWNRGKEKNVNIAVPGRYRVCTGPKPQRPAGPVPLPSGWPAAR